MLHHSYFRTKTLTAEKLQSKSIAVHRSFVLPRCILQMTFQNSPSRSMQNMRSRLQLSLQSMAMLSELFGRSLGPAWKSGLQT